MDITITTHSESNRNEFHDFIKERVRRTLRRFSTRIAWVNVAITDVNGLRGGIDKQCRICVCMPAIGEMVCTATDEKARAAVAAAAVRAKRMVLRKLKRPRSLLDRCRRNRFRNRTASEDTDYLNSQEIQE